MTQRWTGFVALLVLAVLAAACGASDVQSQAGEPESLQFADATTALTAPDPVSAGETVFDPSQLDDLDGPYWLMASCDGETAEYWLVSQDGADSRLLVTFPKDNCRPALLTGIISPSGSAMLLPVNGVRDVGAASALVSVAGEVWDVPVAAEGAWSPDESRVLAPMRSDPRRDDEGGEVEFYSGHEYFAIDVATGDLEAAIPNRRGVRKILWWESADRVLAGQHGPAGTRPFWFDLGAVENEPVEDYYRLGAVGVDDAASIDSGWREVAFDDSTEICELANGLSEFDETFIYLEFPDPPEACIVSVDGVVDENFLVSIEGEDPVDGWTTNDLFFVDPTTGRAIEFMDSTSELFFVQHVEPAGQIVVDRTNKDSRQSRVVVLDSSGNELATLFEGEGHLPRILGLFNQ